jgi:hypothetical protein
MGRLFITTVGTSVLDKEKLRVHMLSEEWRLLGSEIRVAQDDGRYRSWLGSDPDPPPSRRVLDFEATLARYLSELDWDAEVQKPTSEERNLLSAEMTTLHLLQPTPSDHLVLLVSDTADGTVAAKVLASVMTARGLGVTVHLVPDLQPKSLAAFFPAGWEAYYRAVKASRAAHPDLEPVLVATGGFKALIPYSTYLALIEQIPFALVFEDQPAVIWIPPPFAVTEKMLAEAQRSAQRAAGLPPAVLQAAPTPPMLSADEQDSWA